MRKCDFAFLNKTQICSFDIKKTSFCDFDDKIHFSWFGVKHGFVVWRIVWFYNFRRIAWFFIFLWFWQENPIWQFGWETLILFVMVKKIDKKNLILLFGEKSWFWAITWIYYFDKKNWFYSFGKKIRFCSFDEKNLILWVWRENIILYFWIKTWFYGFDEKMIF